MTGWSNVLQYAGVNLPDLIIEHTNRNFYGLCDELFGDLLAGRSCLPANNDDQFFAHLIRENVFTLTVKDDFISNYLREAIVAHAYRKVSPEFLAEAESFRDRTSPWLLFTVRLDNRAWVNQEEGWIQLIRQLKIDFPGLGVMFDGLSSDSVKGWTTGWMSLEAELAVANKVKESVGDLPIIFGIGRTFFESIVLCDMVDAFVAPVGSGMTVYKWLTNKPGVAFSNRTTLNNERTWGPLRVWDYNCEIIEPAHYLPMDKVTDVDGGRDQQSRANFMLDWKDLYAFVRPFLAERFPQIERA
jgi:hypothetical protein